MGTFYVEVKVKAKPGKQNIDQAAIAEIPYLPGVQRDMHRRADNVAAYQREHVGVKTGQLLSTIRVEADTPSVLVTAGRAGRTPQLGYQIYGTSPHVIRPRSAGGTLAFFWEKAGRMAYFKQVSHPGTRVNAFVQESIYAAAP